jgi:hypothetical protein
MQARFAAGSLTSPCKKPKPLNTASAFLFLRWRESDDGRHIACRETLIDVMLKSRTEESTQFTQPACAPGAEDRMSNIQLDIEWTEAASRKIEKLMPRGNQDAFLALPPVECLPMEGDVLFLGPAGKQQPFIVAERQYHHEGDADWTIILILDVPQATH